MERDELFEKLEMMKEIMGTDDLLMEIALSMNTKDLEETLTFIDRMNDTDVFNEEE